MLIDERGALTFAELAPALERARPGASRERGVEPGDGVAIMCRNHRGFVDATLAISKLGASGLLHEHRLRRARSCADVIEREGPAALDLRRGVRGAARASAERGRTLTRFVAWSDDGDERGRRRRSTS